MSLDKWLEDRQVEEELKMSAVDTADNKRTLNLKHAKCSAKSQTKPKQG